MQEPHAFDDEFDEEELGASIYNASRTAKLIRAQKEREDQGRNPLVAGPKKAAISVPPSVKRAVEIGETGVSNDAGGVRKKPRRNPVRSAAIDATHKNFLSALAATANIVPAAVTSSAAGSGGFSGNDPPLYGVAAKDIKPHFRAGDKVYAAWWEDSRRECAPSWYPGTVKWCKRVKEVESNDSSSVRRSGREHQRCYGPLRLYHVKFDDGDELDGIEDRYVFSKDDYLLQIPSNNGNDEGKAFSVGNKWIGVTTVTDPKSTDGWASTVGWYNVTKRDGQKQSFSFLSDALKSYDASVIDAQGALAKVDPSELNLPGELKAKRAVKRKAIEREASSPSLEILEWNNAMPRRRMQKTVVPGLNLKVQFDDNKWYKGVVNRVIKKGHQIEIKYEDGTTEVAYFPDKDIIIEDNWSSLKSRKRQRQDVMVGQRLMSQFNDGAWYEGVVDCVINNGHKIQIKYGDGSKEVSSFPDNSIVIVHDNDKEAHNTSTENSVGSSCSDSCGGDASDDGVDNDNHSARIDSNMMIGESDINYGEKNKSAPLRKNNRIVSKKRKRRSTQMRRSQEAQNCQTETRW
eukprot:CAMPEP_0183723064 /NCGR_PEP_ID=MMETSP0737-20130205/14797_1 /TAXON_ID=385413 /ORGANISM="Thalassiosira miniscula, Strain CCMP1093" /LENGTH=573 /DNA_ID=CAMNT_0025953315 /DNA_START=84 /DNA_END=1802 /DNA_ORIENTATION=-